MTEETRDIATKRLALIRKLIELAYTYSDKEVFHRKFMDAVHIESLKDSELVDIRGFVPQISGNDKLSDEEIEMSCLMHQGFTAKEIAVIYREKSVNSVYVKKHRLKKKLGGAASPEIVMVLLIQCVLLLLIAQFAGLM